MLSFKKYHQLNETLTNQQRKWVDKRSAPYQRRIHDELFKNPPEGATKIDDDTFTMPVSHVDKDRENEIRDHLDQHGYTIHDYVGDHITDKHGRPTSIGKALRKTKKDPNLYASDPRVRSRESGEISGDTHEIVVSRHPYHVAGMSSGRDWNSCMTLPGDPKNQYGGQYHSKVRNDLENGTLVAYLTKKGVARPNKELDRSEALSRIALKKYEASDDAPIWRAETNSYSPSSTGHGSSREKYPQFEKAVKEFGENQWKANPESVHFKNPELYNDDGKTVADDSNFDEWGPEKIHSYKKHIDDLESKYENDYVKEPDYIHGHRMRIALHPNTSTKTLESMVPDEDDRYSTYDDKSWNGDGTKRSLLDTIATHKNANPNVLRKIINNHPDDLDYLEDLPEKMVTHPDSTEDDLAQFHDHDYLHPHIVNHPNVGDESLGHIYTEQTGRYGDGNHDIIKKIAHHPKTHDDTHNEMLDDINDDHDVYDNHLKHQVMLGITKYSQTPETLHRIAQMSGHPDIQRLLTKNPNTETHTLQHIYDNLSKHYKEKDTNKSPIITKSLEHGQGHHVYDPAIGEWKRHTYDRSGDLVEYNVPKETQKSLNRKHKTEIKSAHDAHDRFLSTSQGKIIRNLAGHPNTSMAQLQDISDSNHTTGSIIAKNRLMKGKVNRLL